LTDQPRRTENASSFTEFDFICTDKGRHRPTPLLKAMIGPGPDDFRAVGEYPSYHPAGRESILGWAPSSHRLVCARCGWDFRRTHENLLEDVRRLRQLGITVLDISGWPF